MKTRGSSRGRKLAGASAVPLLLLLPLPPAGAAEIIARQEVVPTITITADASTHGEADGPMSFTLHASPAPEGDLEVKLYSEMTGVIFTDVVERSFTERIPAGEASHSFEFVIVNDFTVEPDGEVTISIDDSEMAYAVGSPAEAETALVDDDEPITVTWDSSTIHVDESAGTFTVPIFLRVHDGEPPGTWRSAMGLHEGIGFLITTEPVTADPTNDFVYQSPSLAFDVGSFTVDDSGDYTLAVDVEFEILDDTDEESGESFQLVFEHLVPEALQNDGSVLPTEPKTVVIADNDGTPERPWPPPDFCPTHPDTPADISTPLIVEVGGSAEGNFCGKDDADWVQVTLAAGQAYRIEGAFDGTDGERPIRIAAMHDPDGQLITGTHSFEGNPYGTSNTSGYIDFRPTETGTHYIEVGNMRWYHFEDATAPLGWRIEVNEVDLPPDDVSDVLQLTQEFNNYGQLVAAFDGTIDTHGDRDTYAIDVVLGHQYFVQMRPRNGSGIFNCIHDLGAEATADPSGNRGFLGCEHRPGWKNSLWFTARHEGRYLITVGSDNGTGDYELSIRDRNAVPPGVWDTPLPDDDIGQDTSTTGLIYINDSWLTGTAVAGEIDLAGDKDWFRVELEADRRYQLDIRGEGTGAGTLRISYVWIHDATGERLIYASGGGDSFFDTRLVWTPPTSGTYFIQVAGSQYEIGTYDLSVIDLEDLYTTHRPS